MILLLITVLSATPLLLIDFSFSESGFLAWTEHLSEFTAL